jgi:hypothetical protein
MKLKLSVLLAGALALLALALIAGAPSAAAQTAPTPTPEAAGAAASELVTMTVTGVITNGTVGAANPAGGLTVNLNAFDPQSSMGDVSTFTTTLAADGSFAFANVAAQAGWQMAVSTEYNGVLYSSALSTIAAGQPTVDLPVTVYETTTETTTVGVQQMHVFFDFGSGNLGVVELYILENSGDRAVVNPKGAIEFALPAGATGLQVQGELEGVDYISTAQGFAEIRPVTPGQGTGQILLSFDLPYSGQLKFEQALLRPVSAVGVLVPENGVNLTSSLLQDEGVQNMASNPYRVYGGTDLAAGSSLTFQLSGQPSSVVPTPAAAAAASPAQGGLDSRSLGIGIGVLGIVVVVVGVWFYRRQGQAAAESARPGARVSQDDLIQSIADLDDAFEAGEVEAAVYERRRAKLKAQLVELMTAGEK